MEVRSCRLSPDSLRPLLDMGNTTRELGGLGQGDRVDEVRGSKEKKTRKKK